VERGGARLGRAWRGGAGQEHGKARNVEWRGLSEARDVEGQGKAGRGQAGARQGTWRGMARLGLARAGLEQGKEHGAAWPG
jgi:hypothetical protein